MRNKLTTEEFVHRAREVHGDKYDYSKVVYTNTTTKVCIICPIHGEFWQTPKAHLRGQGCPKCGHDKLSQMFSLSQEEFISRARKVHGDKYDYSKVVYVNYSTKVCIICNESHKEFWQTPSNHLNGKGCPCCSGRRLWDKRGRITTEDFIKRARGIHGDKYDYSKSVYVNMNTKICIICKTCGREFWQEPNSHLQGSGCPTCGLTKNKKTPRYNGRRLSFGVGVNDYKYTQENRDENYWTSLGLWHKIIERCHSEKWHKKRPTYIGCSVCEEWLLYSNFKKWFEDPINGYRKGYQVDKDILIKGNKVYSPETCCFVPPFINSLLTNRKRFRGAYPIGVFRRPNGKYFAEMTRYGKHKKLGDFFTIEEAFNAYKEAKEAYIREVAQDYFERGLITQRVYNALLNYKIEITD